MAHAKTDRVSKNTSGRIWEKKSLILPGTTKAEGTREAVRRNEDSEDKYRVMIDTVRHLLVVGSGRCSTNS